MSSDNRTESTSHDKGFSPTASIDEIRQAATQGFAPSQRILGLCYLMGHGIEQSEEEAARWLRTAADKGDSHAQYFLGSLYEEGTGVPQSDPQAALWYGLAAGQGIADAQYCLGKLYIWGRDVPKNTKKAEALVRSAANQGSPDAQNFLGELLEHVYANRSKAAHWYAKAAEQGNADAQFNLGRLIRAGIPVPIASDDEAGRWLREAEAHLVGSENCSPDIYPAEYTDVIDGAEGAIKWLSAAADQQHPRAQALLAEMYEQGEGFKQSMRKAIDLYKQAAKGGDTEAQLRLSEIYRLGHGVKVDQEEAKMWFQMAADGSPWGALATGLLSKREDDVKLAAQRIFALHLSNDFGEIYAPEPPQRFDALLDSVSSQDWPAVLVLRGILHFIHGRTDLTFAKRCFRQAEDTGDPLAAYYLAEIAFRGLGENPNPTLASKHLEKCFKSLRHHDDLSRVVRPRRDQADDFSHRSYYEKEFETWLLGTARSLDANIKINLAREETHKQTLSFLTHTLNNALSTGPETVRTVIEILGSDLYDKGQEQYKAINNMASLFPVFLFAESLLRTFKLYVSDPEQIREKWKNDKSGDANVSLVMAMALRQSVARFVFSSNHLAQLKRLLPRQDKEAIKNIRKSFVDEIIPLEITVKTAGKIFQWIEAHFGVLQVRIDADAEMSFTSNATRYMFFFAAFSELIYNALKYADGKRPIDVKWFRRGDQYCLACVNSCPPTTNGQVVQEGTNKGLYFIDKLMSMLEDSALCCTVENGEYRALLTFGHKNFAEGSV